MHLSCFKRLISLRRTALVGCLGVLLLPLFAWAQQTAPWPAQSPEVPAVAQTIDCERLPDIRRHLQPLTAKPATQPDARLREPLRALQALAAACDHNAAYHALLGQMLLQAGWPLDAAVALEKSLLLDPEQRGVQIDYALALAQLGQAATAAALVEDIRSTPGIAPALSEWLSSAVEPWAYRQSGQPERHERWQWDLVLDAGIGHEQNLNSATFRDKLTLFVSNGYVEVDLADSSRPVAGATRRAGLQAQGSTALAGLGLRLGLALQSRTAPGVPDRVAAQGRAALDWPSPYGNLALELGGTGVSWWGAERQQSLDIGTRLIWSPRRSHNTCQDNHALGWSYQQLSTQQDMAGRVQTIGSLLECAWTDRNRTTLAISLGHDQPVDAARPGGARHVRDATWRQTWAYPLANGQQRAAPWAPEQLSAWVRRYQSRDGGIYSLLISDQPIRTQRTDWGLGLSWRLSRSWALALDVDRMRQSSTNDLLDLKNTAWSLTLRWSPSRSSNRLP